jgi:3-oxoacyl-[acyl-carrier protein] reductase
LNGKKFLVTGGSRGIGQATVLALAEMSADVAFTYNCSKEAAEAVLRSAEKAPGRIIAVQADAGNYKEARQTVDSVQETLGGLDGIVLNAGITHDQLLVMTAEESWDEVISTNLKGTFNYARASIYRMIQQRSGRIVCVSSVSGAVMGVAGQTSYASTKAAQIGFVKSLSKEVASYGITVNAVAPGFIETDIWHAIPPARRATLLKTIPLQRLGQPEEVAATIRFLLSPDASYITGSVLVIDGGLSS